MAKFTTEKFIEKAKSVHGGKYDYSQSDYQGSGKKVCVICPKHGPFWQRAGEHMKGQGCPHNECRGKRIADSNKRTNMERYGTTSPLSRPDVRQKIKQVRSISFEEFLERAMSVHGDKYDYGEVNYINYRTEVKIVCKEHGPFFQKPVNHVNSYGCPVCSKIQQRKTNMERYGVEVTSKAASVKEKARKTCQERYGGNGPQSSKEIREKTVATLQLRYGITNPMDSDVFRNAIRNSNLLRYGVDWAAQNPDIRARQVDTCQERYGGRSPLCSPMIREKGLMSMLTRYGVSHPMFSDEIKSRVFNTSFERYGVYHPAQSDEIQKKTKQISLSIYGTEHPMQSQRVKDKVRESKRLNHTFHTSHPEEMAYDILCTTFGQSDVMRQYQSDKYPFACDFYIKSEDLYIELNLSWTHGGGFFDKDNPEDCNKLKVWQERSVTSTYYKNAIEVWTNRDLLKLQTAIDNDLNYLTFWDNELKDFYWWLDMFLERKEK